MDKDEPHTGDSYSRKSQRKAHAGDSPDTSAGRDAFRQRVEERPRRIFVCIGASCSEQKSRGILTEFKKQIARHNLRVEVYTATCLSQCLRAPAVQVFPEGTFYCKILPRDVRTIVSEHLEKGRIVEHFVHDPFAAIRWNDEIDS